ncbi:hypothetical protein FACS1894151_03850 [Spirochaetia bacterium]|nr:hypothetical protein FACS1894151_03850 [Spirochaetia bacterium]
MPEENNHAQLFDSCFKFLMCLSDKAVISFINGLFEANHPLDSPVTGLNNESIKQSLWKTYRKSIKDIILKIGNESIYHIETQIQSDAVMITRMFQYGFDIAQKVKKRGKHRELYLPFPEQMVIYLERGPKQKQLQVLLEFPGKPPYKYEVPVLRLKDQDVQTLEDRQLLLLVVFKVLKLRKQGGDRKMIARELAGIMGDIIGSIDRGVASGLLTAEDKDNMLAIETKLTSELYDEQIIREVNMSDETAIAELRQTLEAIHEKHELIRQLAEKDRLQQEQAQVILELKRQLKKPGSSQVPDMSDETAIAEHKQTFDAIHEKHELIRQLAEKDRLQQEKDRQLAEERRLQQEKDEVILELKRQLEEARQLSGSKYE